MRWSLSISILVHAAILVSAFAALPKPEEFEVKKSEPVPVEMVSEKELIKPPKPEEPPKEEKKPEPKPVPKRDVAALAPKQEPVLLPEPDKKPQEKPKAEPKPPEPEPVPEKAAEAPKPKVKIIPPPPRKPKPPKRVVEKNATRFDDDINALLNKIPDDPGPKPPETTDDPQTVDVASTAPDLQSGTKLERDEIAAIINAKMQECWTPPPGVANVRGLKVKLSLSFQRSGQLAGQPQNQTQIADSLTRATVESAKRALIRCAPYNLPQDSYDVWKDMVLTFNPGVMFR